MTDLDLFNMNEGFSVVFLNKFGILNDLLLELAFVFVECFICVCRISYLVDFVQESGQI